MTSPAAAILMHGIHTNDGPTAPISTGPGYPGGPVVGGPNNTWAGLGGASGPEGYLNVGFTDRANADQSRMTGWTADTPINLYLNGSLITDNFQTTQINSSGQVVQTLEMSAQYGNSQYWNVWFEMTVSQSKFMSGYGDWNTAVQMNAQWAANALTDEMRGDNGYLLTSGNADLLASFAQVVAERDASYNLSSPGAGAHSVVANGAERTTLNIAGSGLGDTHHLDSQMKLALPTHFS